MRDGEIHYWCGITFLSFQCPISLKPALNESRLWVQQSKKQDQCPELSLHAAGCVIHHSVQFQPINPLCGVLPGHEPHVPCHRRAKREREEVGGERQREREIERELSLCLEL